MEFTNVNIIKQQVYSSTFLTKDSRFSIFLNFI